MPNTAQELKEKFLRTLDNDNNVVDMVGVLETISALEKFPITREALEQTRLGRYVNEMRRKTTNKELARRAKDLVRSWQQLVAPQTTNTINGDNVALRSGGYQGQRLSPRITISPALSQTSRVSTPRGHASPALGPGAVASPALSTGKGNKYKAQGSPAKLAGSRSSPAGLSQSSSPGMPPTRSRPITPVSGGSSRSGTPINVQQATKISPGLPRASRPATPGSAQASRLSPGVVQPGGRQGAGKLVSPAVMERTKTSNGFECHSISPPTVSSVGVSETVDRTNIANRKRQRNGDTLPEQPSKKTPALVGSDSKDSKENACSTTVNGLLSIKCDRSGGAVQSPAIKSLSRSSSASSLNTQAAIALESKISPSGSSSKGGLSNRRNTNLSLKTEMDKSMVTSRTPKVKTTAQLIAELQAKSSSPNLGSKTIKKIQTNQIQKEVEVQESIVPAGAKPRPRRNPSVGTPTQLPRVGEVTLSQTKTELVQKFLQSSVTPEDLSSPLDSIGRTQSPANFDVSFANSDSLPNSADVSLQSVKSELDIYKEVINTEETYPKEELDPYSLLPPLNLDEIKLEEESNGDEVQSLPEVTDLTVERLNEERWPGINGNYDCDGEWNDWSKTISMPTYESETLHILPYVNIDD
ncbi:mediator of RNA polymerase II transcription subunit 26 [Lingula anatina]|uniref:Mediator of RNA polymerase II transcription subunit 26 n=1 Tax=Lingula anatina TaxID=7574 RepID=A0A1S3JVK7_LINAN|nr:mediator of RNA polymerase II transcription subunit 26 [Lingula anatina]|eukprot:XP_013414440.1 mediator of RNA polymerase II transcription subunit 26 [Lingula anatina]